MILLGIAISDRMPLFGLSTLPLHSVLHAYKSSLPSQLHSPFSFFFFFITHITVENLAFAKGGFLKDKLKARQSRAKLVLDKITSRAEIVDIDTSSQNKSYTIYNL